MKNRLILKILHYITSIYFYIGIVVIIALTPDIFFNTSIIQNNLIGSFDEVFKGVWYMDLISAFGIYIPLILITYIAFELSKLFKNLENSKEVFTIKTSKQIKKITTLLFIHSIIHISPTLIFFSLVVLSFSEIFSYGVKLEEERKLTI